MSAHRKQKQSFCMLQIYIPSGCFFVFFFRLVLTNDFFFRSSTYMSWVDRVYVCVCVLHTCVSVSARVCGGRSCVSMCARACELQNCIGALYKFNSFA